MIAAVFALAVQAAAPAAAPEWRHDRFGDFCRMTFPLASGKGTLAVLADNAGNAGFVATSRSWPHRSGEADAEYLFDAGKSVVTRAEWQGDFETGPQGHVHGFIVEADGKFLDRLADSRQLAVATFTVRGLDARPVVDVQDGIVTGAPAKTAVAQLRACIKALPKPAKR